MQPKIPDAPDSHANEEGHERIFLVVPAFGTTDRPDAPPLSAKQKFALASRQAFDPFMWISTGIQAGMSQASIEFPEYGQGASGYGKRYGAAMLDVVNGGFVGTGYCVLLKQEPTVFPPWYRVDHASRSLLLGAAGFREKRQRNASIQLVKYTWDVYNQCDFERLLPAP